ncbi:FAD binding domain-containing protein [Thermosphaera aggregans]|uniref:FAD binding domain-containing protein n=1 Tax=Thermosphaera aggregans TaxID=54254 RepID=UPI0011E56B57|nr:FAD binding domain-containing protein [Thermosphaera aggregans]
MFRLYRPRSIEDALEFLSKNAPDVKPLAGGTELLVLIRDKKIPTPKYLLDLTPLKKQLSYVKIEEGKVKIGSTTTLYELSRTFLHSDVRFAGFVDVWKKFGTFAIRFSATIGGNLAAATQYSDYITLLLAYDARVKAISANGERTIPVEKLVLDKRVTSLRPDELIKEVEFDAPPESSSSSFIKFDRRELLIAGIVTGAFFLRLDQGKIQDVKVAFDMVKDKRVPARAREVENFLLGKMFSEELVNQAADEILPASMERITDWWTTAEYRLDMSKIALKRGLLKCKTRIEKGVV